MADSVSDFVSVTGASREAASRFLEACGGNVNLAVETYLDNPSLFQGTPLTDASASSTTAKTPEDDDSVRAPIAPTRGVLVEGAVHAVHRKRRHLPTSVFDQDPFKTFKPGDYHGPGDKKKVKSLAQLFQPPVDLIFPGTFREARNEGATYCKWLLVNIQDTQEFACQVLNRDVWNNPKVKDTIKASFIFWQENRIMDDALQFIQFYNVHSFPYVAIIDPRTGENMANWNNLTVQGFTTAVNDFLSSHILEPECQSPAPKRRKDSMCVINDSEESQLAAAIAASIQDTSAACPNDPILIFSDSDDDIGSDDNDSQAMDESDTANSQHTSSQQRADEHHCDNVEAVVTPFPHRSVQDTVCESDLLGRQDSRVDGVRALRNELQTLKVEEKRLASRQIDKSGAGNPAKGKSRAGRSQPLSGRETERVKVIALDEDEMGEMVTTDGRVAAGKEEGGTREEDGVMDGVDLSQLLLRLPDGSRIEKSFPADHPIKNLFHWLAAIDFDCVNGEFEVVSHFPKRCISTLGPDTSFREAGLCPKHTLFVQEV